MNDKNLEIDYDTFMYAYIKAREEGKITIWHKTTMFLLKREYLREIGVLKKE